MGANLWLVGVAEGSNQRDQYECLPIPSLAIPREKGGLVFEACPIKQKDGMHGQEEDAGKRRPGWFG